MSSPFGRRKLSETQARCCLRALHKDVISGGHYEIFSKQMCHRPWQLSAVVDRLVLWFICMVFMHVCFDSVLEICAEFSCFILYKPTDRHDSKKDDANTSFLSMEPACNVSAALSK